MSFLAVLDATTLCARHSAALSETAWARPVPVAVREPAPPAPFSWRSLARNPQAMVLTAMVASMVTRDTVARSLLS